MFWYTLKVLHKSQSEKVMSKIIIITGGARSGKSSFAEKLALDMNMRTTYVATSIPFDDEMKERVRLHKERRPSEWNTVEAYKDLDIALNKVIDETDVVLLDCVTVMITNLMMDSISDWDNISVEDAGKVEKLVIDELDKLINYFEELDKILIIVTNEVGLGIVPMYPSARLFRDMAGRANQKLASTADEVHMCVSGIPLKIK